MRPRFPGLKFGAAGKAWTARDPNDLLRFSSPGLKSGVARNVRGYKACDTPTISFAAP